MKQYYFTFTFLCAFLMFSCTSEPVPEQQIQTTEPVQEFVPGTMNIKFSEDMADLVAADLRSGGAVTKASSPEIEGLYSTLGIVSMERLFQDGGEFEPRMRKAGLDRWYKVTYDQSVPVTKAAADFSSVAGVEITEPVRSIKLSDTFNDPMLYQQWHYYNDGTLTSRHRAGADINVKPVWENYTTGNENVIVSIVDGGIDLEHEDLAWNCLSGSNVHRNFVDNNYRIVPHNHGTHVAGTVAAVNGNGIGVCGVAGGNYAAGVHGVKLLSCQIFKANPDDPSKDLGADGAQAIVWGANHGAVISQNSWGYSFENPEDGRDVNIEPSLKDAVDYFIRYAGCDNDGNQLPESPMKGGIVIFAAGNDGMPFGPPANYEPIVAVGAIAPDFTRAYYSNYGDWVDIAAPGGSVYYDQGQVLSTTPGDTYGLMQGTSMACPHVSGVAALLVSYYGGPGFTNEMLKTRLLEGANPSAVASSAQIGPLLDAQGSFSYGSTAAPDRVESISATVASNSVNVEWTVTRDSDDGKAYAFLILASKDKADFDGLDCNSIPGGMISVPVLTGDLSAGDAISGRISGLDFESEYFVSVVAYDYARNYSSPSPLVQVTTLRNNPPVINMEYETGEQGRVEVHSFETVRIPFDITDNDGHELTISLEPGSDAASGATDSASGKYIVTIAGNGADPGDYTATVTATDQYGLSSAFTLAYTILPNLPPVITADIEDVIMNAIGEQLAVDMSEHLDDPDGEQLSFSVTVSDVNVLHINPSGNILHMTALGYGNCDVTIVASDSRGESCSLEFSVAVKDPASSLEVYPNPVVDYLNIRTGTEMDTHIVLMTSSGSVVYESTSPVSAFSPARIDMREYAPGRYTLKVSYGDGEFTRNIVKL